MSSVVIVTGASQGIGRATAIRLTRDFKFLMLVAGNLEKLEETASVVKSKGGHALVLDVDLSKPTSAKTIVTRTLKEFGRIDALVNISGAVPQIGLFEMTDEQWDIGLAVKFHGARRLTLRAWDALKESRGSVVFISGNSAVTPKAPYVAVGTINAAIVTLVNSILPGPVMTNRRRTYLEKWALAHEMTLEQAIKIFPAEAGIERFGESEEIAELMSFLVSPGAR